MCPPLELRTLAPCHPPPRHTFARSLSYRAVSYWWCTCVPATNASAAVAFARGARAPALARAAARFSGLRASTPYPRAQDHRRIPTNSYRRTARSRTLYLFVPSRAGGAPAVPPAHARAASRETRGVHVCPQSLGAWRSERSWGLAAASRAQDFRLIPVAVAQYSRALSILPYRPYWRCNCRASSARSRRWRYKREVRVRPPSLGLRRTERAWGLSSASRAQNA